MKPLPQATDTTLDQDEEIYKNKIWRIPFMSNPKARCQSEKNENRIMTGFSN